MKQASRGFTLIEIMVVVAILGVLGLIVAVNVFPNLVTAKQTTARTNIKTLHQAVKSFQMHHSKLPDQLEELLMPCEQNGKSPYIENSDILVDPWDFEYVYIKDSDSQFEIKSLGADNTEGGEEGAQDISSKDTRWRGDKK